MRGRSFLPFCALGIPLAACGLVSGISEYEVDDISASCLGCPPDGGSREDGAVDAPSLNDPCDPTKDADCIELPAGFTLVAVMDVKDAPAADCPMGFATPETVGVNPSLGPNACRCTTCSIETEATCPGVVGRLGQAGNCSAPTAPETFRNDPRGACRNVFFAPFASHLKFTFSNAEGGECTPAPPTRNDDDVIWTGKSRVCTSSTTAGCVAGRCRTSVPAPYRACASATGDTPCPASLPVKTVVGGAEFDCGTTGCSCTVHCAPCTGKLFFYSGQSCGGTEREAVANDSCEAQALAGVWSSYRMTAESETTCTTSGNPPGAGLHLVGTQTLCCR